MLLNPDYLPGDPFPVSRAPDGAGVAEGVDLPGRGHHDQVEGNSLPRMELFRLLSSSECPQKRLLILVAGYCVNKAYQNILH